MAANKDNEGGKESSKPKGILKQEQSIRFAPDIIPGKRGLSEDEDDVPSDIVIRMRDSTVWKYELESVSENLYNLIILDPWQP